MTKVRVHVFIEGYVQGVFFRSNTKSMAQRLRITGWVRNLPDGRVEAVFEGDAEAVKKIIEWCWRGPPGAEVTHVDVRYEEYKGEFDDFSIIYW